MHVSRRSLTTEGHDTFVTLLLSHGACTDTTNFDQRAPLHEAACNGHVAVVTTLLKAGAATGMQDRGGDTPLHWAVCGHVEAAQALLDGGADIDMRNVDGGTPLHAAVINGEESCVKLLVRRCTRCCVLRGSGSPLLVRARWSAVQMWTHAFRQGLTTMMTALQTEETHAFMLLLRMGDWRVSKCLLRQGPSWMS